MLKELLNFAWHAPKAYYLSKTLPQSQLYDLLMLKVEKLGMAKWRAELVGNLSGHVLEIGCGTGLMFPYYPKATQVQAIEPFPKFLDAAKERKRTSPAKINIIAAEGEAIPFKENRFDFVVVGLVMCSVKNQERFLNEIRRVLKPDGEIRLIEHVISKKPVSAFLMDKLNPIWLHLNKQNCHMNRDTEAIIQAHGFHLEDVRSFKILPQGIPAFPMRWIRAVPK